jgi:hypothetical protein
MPAPLNPPALTLIFLRGEALVISAEKVDALLRGILAISEQFPTVVVGPIRPVTHLLPRE